jgi:hypothetical protein
VSFFVSLFLFFFSSKTPLFLLGKNKSH